jgi:TPP-dependent pyruvate/acetoin dehydrogenase alpha subunit
LVSLAPGSGTELDVFLYGRMWTIRHVEETLLALFRQGRMVGTTHTSIGQEACSVGVLSALDPDRDFVWSNHRCHGHYLAFGGDIRALFAELLGRSTGVCGGVGGSQHLCWRNFYTNGIQGGIVPVATGMALAEKWKGSGAVGAVFVGDGTFGEGVLYESMNLAALWGAPLLFAVEDNEYAQSTPKRISHAGRLGARPAAFAVDTVEMEASDVRAVFATAAALVQAIRHDGRPRCLYLHTYRLAPHSLGEDHRPPEEVEAWRQRDPLVRLRRSLPPGVAEAVEDEVRLRVAEALREAMEAPREPFDAYIRRVGA